MSKKHLQAYLHLMILFLIQTIFEGPSKSDDISLYMNFIAKQCTSQQSIISLQNYMENGMSNSKVENEH